MHNLSKLNLGCHDYSSKDPITIQTQTPDATVLFENVIKALYMHKSSHAGL